MRVYRLALAAAAFCGSVWLERHGLRAALVVACAAAASAFASRSVASHQVKALATALAVACVAGVGYAFVRAGPPPLAERRTATYDATVLACDPSAIDGLHALVLRVAGLRLEALARDDLPIGARAVVRGRIEPPDVARNPGEPSPRDLARERGIDGNLERATVLRVAGVDERDASLWVPRLRAWAIARLRARLDEPLASIATGALFGERGALPKALRDEFQETGTTHVLVTAGLHLGVVAALAVLLLELAGCGRVASSVAAIAIVWFYAGLSGGHLPSIRAAAMATVALAARASGRRALSWNAVGFAAIVAVALAPSSVDGVSFAMSFSCVAAIVLFADPLGELLAPLHVPHVLREAIVLTLATQIGTWPLTAATFLTIAPYAPLANLFVVPAVGFIMVNGLALVACADVPLLGAMLANAETTLLAWIVAVVGFVGGLPNAHVVAIPPQPWCVALYDAAAVAAALALRGGHRTAAALLVGTASTLCWIAPHPRPHELRIVVLDVGQADAIVIETPAGHTFLVDAGGRLERGNAAGADSRAEAVGERIVVPYLLRQGIRRIDALLMTHPHGDHVCGAPPVIRDLDVRALADSGQTYPGHCYRQTMQLARERSMPVFEPRGGAVWKTDDGVTFRFYAPTLPYITGSRSDINSNSLVFRLEYGTFRMLFTGDAGTETEARLLALHDDVRAEVLKVGHHGSAYGTTPAFVRAVAPRDAIVSVGRHNLFGHPAPATIATLGENDAHVFRTDRNGAVATTSDGATYEIVPYL